jgi:hypothetical protein
MKSKISFPQGSPTDSVRWSLLLGYRNYIMHCFLFPFCVITCYLVLVARNNIHCCKWTDTKPVLNIFKIKVKQKEKREKINALVENKMYKHDNKCVSMQ